MLPAVCPVFQSTCPARGTTKKRRYPWTELTISIHVPREGHDVARVEFVHFELISIHVPREGHDV